MSNTPAPVAAGMLVFAGIESLSEADPVTGWPEEVEPRTMDARVLLQTQVWVDVRGVIHQLIDMEYDHRANVCEMLRSQEDTLVISAAVGLAAAVAIGYLPEEDMRDRVGALSRLAPGWMDDTPLVRQLRVLNGHAAEPAACGTGSADAGVAELRDSASGLWRVTTETSIYLLDLDRREVLRMGGGARGHHLAADGAMVLAHRFDSDHQWHPLLHLDTCRLGEHMRARQELSGHESQIRSTFVTSIEHVEPP